METSENIVSESSATPSIQHETRVVTPNDEVTVSNNNLVGNLEDFEERISLDIEKVYKKFEEKFISQSKLIESLRARIEYLEIDSVVKDEDIKNLRKEIHESTLAASVAPVTPVQVITNENEQNDQYTELLNTESCVKPLRCKKCGLKFDSYAKYCGHSHQFKCKVCQQTFKTRKKRGKHLRKNHQKEFPCNLCSKKFYFMVGLREHFRAKHSGGKLYHRVTRSSNPPPSTTSANSPSITVSFIHEIIPYQQYPSNILPPYRLKCKICGEIFDTHAQFNKHAKSLHECNFTCPDCSQIFPQKSSRKNHIRRRFRCKFCNKSIRGEGGIVSHCKAKHNHLTNEEIYSGLIGIQFPALQNQISEQENELNELEVTYERGSEEGNDSFGDTEEEDEVSDNNDYTGEENERNGDFEDEASDYTEEENERSGDTDDEASDNEAFDSTDEENEKSGIKHTIT